MPSSDASGEAPLDLTAFHNGEEAVIKHVYLTHSGALFREARRHTGEAEAESVVHDVFVELLRNHELRSRFVGGAMGAWLRQITRLKALEHLRRNGRPIPEEAAEPSASPEDSLEARDLLTRFLERSVPSGQRAFFGLRFLERRTQVEIAAQLGIARSTLEGWEHRLTEKLRAFVLEDR